MANDPTTEIEETPAAPEEQSESQPEPEAPAEEPAESPEEPEAEDAAEDTPEEPAESPEESGPDQRAGIRDRFAAAMSMLSNRGGAADQLATLQAQVQERDATIASLTTERDTAIGERNAAQQESAEAHNLIEQHLGRIRELEGEQQTISQETTDRLAALGVPEEELPASEQESDGTVPMTLTEAREAMANAATPEEKRAIYDANRKLLVND